jgi:hypothetical protein
VGASGQWLTTLHSSRSAPFDKPGVTNDDRDAIHVSAHRTPAKLQERDAPQHQGISVGASCARAVQGVGADVRLASAIRRRVSVNLRLDEEGGRQGIRAVADLNEIPWRVRFA